MRPPAWRPAVYDGWAAIAKTLRALDEFRVEGVETNLGFLKKLLSHPDVLAGKKQAHLLHAKQHPQVRLLADDINPICLLQQVDQVYTVSSQMGFEALLLGKPVTCFGVPALRSLRFACFGGSKGTSS